MEYANKIGVPYIIIIGEEEVANNKYALKDMASGEQLKLTTDEIIEKIEAAGGKAEVI